MSNLKWADVAHYYAKSPLSIIVGKFDHGPEMGMVFDRGLHEKCSYMDHGIWCEVPNGGFVSEWGSHAPILRHLEDMTEGEAQELYAIVYFKAWDWRKYSTDCLKVLLDEVMFSNYGNDFKRVLGNPAAWSWLISKGFDVFGLIESGQAIRKGVENG